jgi:hypothetical protein
MGRVPDHRSFRLSPWFAAEGRGIDCARRLVRALRSSAMAGLLGLLIAGAAHGAEYVVQATVTDIDGRPVDGVQVGVGPIKKDLLKTEVQPEEVGTTDAAGKVSVKVSTDSSTVGAAVIGEAPGRTHTPAEGFIRLAKGANQAAFQLLPPPDDSRTAAGGSAATRGFFGETGEDQYPALETKTVTLEDSPLHLWRAYGGQPGRPVLVVQGLFLTTERPTTMQVFNQAFDLVQGLRRAGRDVWILAFSDPLTAMAAQALAVSDAVRQASEQAGGAKVDVVGISAGGLAARYALARDEATGGPSDGKVGLFATVDTPHQGANIHVGAQAALWAASANTANRILLAAGVQNMLYQWVGGTNFDQNSCRFPLNGTISATPAAHDAFFTELLALNGDGYPHKSRNVAVAAAPAARPQKVGEVIYRLKASAKILFGSVEVCSEEYKARAEDVLPGSTFPTGLLPDEVEVSPITIRLDTRFNPTFIPAASALDLGRATSPFAATFAPPSGEIVHGAFPEGSVAFLLKELTGSA